VSKAVNFLTAETMSTEQAVMWSRRLKEARRAGMTRIEARMFAESEMDIGELRRLVAKGCPPMLLAKLLL
jgi:hypothetical protein